MPTPNISDAAVLAAASADVPSADVPSADAPVAAPAEPRSGESGSLPLPRVWREPLPPPGRAAQAPAPRVTPIEVVPVWAPPQGAPATREDAATDAAIARASVGLNMGQMVCLRGAVRALLQGETWRLTGPAGSGKTFLTQRIREVLESLNRRVIGLAPTGRAALRLSDSVPSATTIHAGIFSRVGEDLEGNPIFNIQDLRFPIEHGAAIIDEASMIGARLRGWIDRATPAGVGVLFQGDHEQLPPVDDAPGVDLARAEGRLTEVVRHAQDSPILSLATAIRTGTQNMGRPDPRLAIHGPSSWADPVAWLARHRQTDIAGDAQLTTWANDTRQRLNRDVRAMLGRGSWLVPDDRLLVRRTNHSNGLLNGEVLLVREVAPLRLFEEDFVQVVAHRPAFAMSEIRLGVMVRSFGAKPKEAAQHRRAFLERILQLLRPGERSMARRGKLPDRYAAEEALLRSCTLVDYGEALTVHALQGSQVRDLGFVMDSAMAWLARKARSATDPDRDLHRRLCYTAVTRAVETLNIWEVR